MFETVSTHSKSTSSPLSRRFTKKRSVHASFAKNVGLFPFVAAAILIGASGASAQSYFCSVDRVCTEQLPCSGLDYIWDMFITETAEGWVFTYEPDDGGRDVYQRIEGTGEAGGAVFLMQARDDGEDGLVTLMTILPDMRFVLSTHYSGEYTNAETAFGTCEAEE